MEFTAVLPSGKQSLKSSFCDFYVLSLNYSLPLPCWYCYWSITKESSAAVDGYCQAKVNDAKKGEVRWEDLMFALISSFLLFVLLKHHCYQSH